MFLTCHPVHIVLTNVFAKASVSLLLLHIEHLRHLRIGSAELQFPAYQPLVNIDPVLPRATVHNLHRQLLELLLITGLHRLRHDFAAMDILLQRQQYLVGVDGFDQIVSYLLADGLVHDVFLFALRHHHDGNLRSYLLDAL